MTMGSRTTRSAIVVAVAVATVVGVAVAVNAWMSALVIPGMHHAPTASDLLTTVSVTNTSPLVLTAKLRWNSTDDNISLSEAHITDNNQTVLATYRGEYVGGKDGYQKPLCVLQNFGEEKTLTMDFNTSLPPGSYALWFCTHAFCAFTHADFTIP